MVPNENETEIRRLMTVMQKLYMITDFKILFEIPLKPIMLEKVQFQVTVILLASPPPQTFCNNYKRS